MTDRFYSPTDILRYISCHHSAVLQITNTPVKNPENDHDWQEILFRIGNEYESKFLADSKNNFQTITEIPNQGDYRARYQLTLDSMRRGDDMIYQAVLLNPPMMGIADFLVKTDTPSDLGNYSYEVLDTKTSRRPHPEQVLQITAYSDLLSYAQGLEPASMYIQLSNGDLNSFNVREFIHYFRRVQKQFLQFATSLPAVSYPEPCSYCEKCKFKSNCETQWADDSHLSLVFDMRTSQRKKLVDAGIDTVEKLAKSDPLLKVPQLPNEMYSKLRLQAVIQTYKKETGNNKVEIKYPMEPGKGFSRIPEPDYGDVFFDIEGDPTDPEGLEYLFGIYYKEGDDYKFDAIWAHTHEEEAQAINTLLMFFNERFKKYPLAHIYHYNHYEPTALKKLTAKYSIHENELDELLRRRRFVDLYIAAREAIRTSEPGLSLKNLENFYDLDRAADVVSSIGSVVYYDRWKRTQDPEILNEIAEYNKNDVESTQLCAEWLRSIRPADTEPYIMPEIQEELTEHEETHELTMEEQLDLIDGDNISIAQTTSLLLGFYQRENRPLWWDRFNRSTKEREELLEDPECVINMTLTGDVVPDKKSFIYTYDYPEQEISFRKGEEITYLDHPMGNTRVRIYNIDEKIRQVKLRTTNSEMPANLDIGPSSPQNYSIPQSALLRFSESIVNEDIPYDAILDLLNRQPPNIKGITRGAPIIQSGDLLSEIRYIIPNLQNSCLSIQGPPGAGKTYSASRAIVDLLKSGNRIGIASNSHKAINNLLDGIMKAAREQNFVFKGVKKSTVDYDISEFDDGYDGQYIENNAYTLQREDFLYPYEECTNSMCKRPRTRQDRLPVGSPYSEGTCPSCGSYGFGSSGVFHIRLYAGTAWSFSQERFDQLFDYMFIDEAGQLSMAHTIAIATAAKNLVLIGDQMQLPQPTVATHPGDSGLSSLEYLLKDYSTIPPEMGIFLKDTYRMHPAVCSFISDAIYEGKLLPMPENIRQTLQIQDSNLPEAGIVMAKINHEDCRRRSFEEVGTIVNLFNSLIGSIFTDKNNETRIITMDDIMIVSPYNQQVNALQAELPQARVGTVDMFQGQEAPIVLISMATSSGEDMPRNPEFLFSKNRLNVAVSRAQSLAIMVMSPDLLEAQCNNIDQMKLLDTFCWLDEYANPVPNESRMFSAPD